MKTTAERKAILAGESQPWDWLNSLAPGSQRPPAWVRALATCVFLTPPTPPKVVNGTDPLRGHCQGFKVTEPHTQLVLHRETGET